MNYTNDIRNATCYIEDVWFESHSHDDKGMH